VEKKREETVSIWQELELGFLPALSSHQQSDVCVIGGGISGLLIAYQLLKSGKSVVVLERESLGLGQTSLTSAHLSFVLDRSFHKLQRLNGKKNARLAVEAHRDAIAEIEQIIREERIECEFERINGFLFYGEGESEKTLEKELRAAQECGIENAELLAQAPSRSFQTGPCLRFPNQAIFHPQKFLAGLSQAVIQRGGKIFPHTNVMQVEPGKPMRVLTGRGFQIACQDVVAATHAPFAVPSSMHAKLAPYRTYVAAFRMPEDKTDKALFWDTSNPYHYLRFARDSRGSILLIGGEDHRTGQIPDGSPYGNLRNWARDRLGISQDLEHSWSGQILETPDGLAYIGRSPKFEDHIFMVSGDCGSGLTHAAIASTLLRDLILERENSLEEVFDPSRLHLTSLKNFLLESSFGGAAYSDWVTAGDVETYDEIRKGEGAVVRDGANKIAAYRDNHGHLHLYSAVCPHWKGIVRWNTAEKTWDCPCHGSRFEKTGKVICGPAVCGLKEIVGGEVEERKQASA
jgi:glycine/D-amino acid oxidase-like deaminating enzyme/nitrite reductase/ring-hydroxylating ferredoxin subunit